MKYAEVRFLGNVRLGERDGGFYVAGPNLTLTRAGDTFTLTAPGATVDVPWSTVAYAKRLPEEPKVAPAEEPKPSGQTRRAR